MKDSRKIIDMLNADDVDLQLLMKEQQRLKQEKAVKDAEILAKTEAERRASVNAELRELQQNQSVLTVKAGQRLECNFCHSDKGELFFSTVGASQQPVTLFKCLNPLCVPQLKHPMQNQQYASRRTYYAPSKRKSMAEAGSFNFDLAFIETHAKLDALPPP